MKTKCPKHPKVTWRSIKPGCADCLQLYADHLKYMSSPKPKATKVIDKVGYTRKRKHKNENV